MTKKEEALAKATVKYDACMVAASDTSNAEFIASFAKGHPLSTFEVNANLTKAQGKCWDTFAADMDAVTSMPDIHPAVIPPDAPVRVESKGEEAKRKALLGANQLVISKMNDDLELKAVDEGIVLEKFGKPGEIIIESPKEKPQKGKP